jgi:hypothetical protein
VPLPELEVEGGQYNDGTYSIFHGSSQVVGTVYAVGSSR